MGNFGDDFLVSNYIKPVNEYVDDRNNYLFSSLRYSSYEIDQAKEWAQKAFRTIIYPTSTLKELEELWFNFCMMPTNKRTESDDISIQLFGINNQYHYEFLKSEFLKDDIDNSDIESVIESFSITNGSEFEGVSYTPFDGSKAMEWSRETGYPIIYPTRTLEDLEELWNNFNLYPEHVRIVSDDKSVEIFGICNTEHYKYLKSIYVKEDIPKVQDEEIVESFIGDAIISHQTFAMNEDVDTSTRAKDLLRLICRNNESYEGYIISDIVDKSTTQYKLSNQNLKFDTIPFEDLPFFTPEEMIDFGVNQANPEDNFYGCEPISNIFSEDGMNWDTWFNQYCHSCSGYYRNYNPIDWLSSMRNLFIKRDTAADPNPYNQAILSLGWPPEADFTSENRIKATKRLKSKLLDMNGSVQFVDLTGMNPGKVNESAVIEDTKLYPVFIVLEEGKSILSAAIKKVTNSNYSHAAISFDPTMETMYSYGIEGSENGMKGGFIKEHIKDKDPDRHMAVFAIFLKKEDWQKLKDIIEDFIKNVEKTSYSYINLLISHIFNIPMNMSKKMVCSQFVDKILKLVDIDLSKKNSSLVNPADFEKYAKENKKIYILFDDFVAKFKPSRIKGLVTRLSKKATPIKESILWTDDLGIVFEMMNNIDNLAMLQEISRNINLDTIDSSARKIYESMIAPCLEAEVYIEAKDFPVQFDKDGNLFVKNIKKRDYEGEYAKCHRLLRKYKESGNIEGIKYELCKLWMMNSVIEEKLHSKKFEELPSFAVESSKEHKARAKILNDFNHFLNVVLEEEPDFNFEEYFNQSPFNDALIKINKDTIIWSGRLLKALMKSLL